MASNEFQADHVLGVSDPTRYLIHFLKGINIEYQPEKPGAWMQELAKRHGHGPDAFQEVGYVVARVLCALLGFSYADSKLYIYCEVQSRGGTMTMTRLVDEDLNKSRFGFMVLQRTVHLPTLASKQGFDETMRSLAVDLQRNLALSDGMMGAATRAVLQT